MKRMCQITQVPVSLIILVLVLIMVITGPLLINYDYLTHDLSSSYKAPGHEHLMGTDKFGRDVFSRVLYGGRVSLLVAFCSVALSLIIGLPYGLMSGYWGKHIDFVMNGLVHIFMAIPQFLLILSVVAVLQKNSVFWVILIISLFSWMDIARLARNQTLSIKEKDFVLSERVLGVSVSRILFRHIMPNLLGPVAVSATLLFGNVILIESALSFIGLGVQAPLPSWGNIINDGRQVLLAGWWISVFPGIFIVLVVFSVNMIGEYMQQKFFNLK